MLDVIIAEADHQKGALGIRQAAPMKVKQSWRKKHYIQRN
jgi:hypothetical protein